MYIDADFINQTASLIGSLAVIAGVILAVYKIVQRDKLQSKIIRSIQDEQTLLCYGMKACLQGLSEQGCDGPVHDALKKLDKHLNQKAHAAEEVLE